MAWIVGELLRLLLASEDAIFSAELTPAFEITLTEERLLAGGEASGRRGVAGSALEAWFGET